MKNFSLLLLIQVTISSSLAFAAGEFLEPLPKWAQDSLYSGSYLNIDQVMRNENLTRFQAIEVQNQMRDQMQASAIDAREAYASALASVRSGKYESGYKEIAFAKPGEFVAVLDMDETLLVQWYASGAQGNFDIKDVLPDVVGSIRSGTFVKLTPNAEKFIRRLKSNPLCRGVVIFTAKEDRVDLDIIAKWKFADGSPATDHISGVFTRNHLVLGSKVWSPSKDMRIFDPELKHVVMVDDNPGRIFQPLVLLAQPKFDADQYDKAKRENNAVVVDHYEYALNSAANDILESARAAEALSIPFAQAFIPNSYAGERVTKSLTRKLRSRRDALEASRLNPTLQEAAFVSVPVPAPTP